jgi:transposase-like protein
VVGGHPAGGEAPGLGTESLRGWIKQAEIDSGQRPGVTTAESVRVAELERENRELRRANEILKAASLSLRGSSTRDCRGSRVHQGASGPDH